MTASLPVHASSSSAAETGVWHATAPAAVAAALNVSPTQGLTAAEAAARLATHGPNRIEGRPPRPAWLTFLDQFRNFLVIVLFGAAVLAGAVGDFKDAAVIAVVLLLNATLGFYQEHRAEAALAALKKMLAPVARVRRDGLSALVPAETLVPGDVLLLVAGDRIPADARVFEAHSAEVAEAALTGESHAVTKTPEVVAEQSALAERRGMVYMNTVVTRGRLETIVVDTGMQTEMGRLAGLLAEATESATPLQVQLDQLGKRLAAIAGAVVLLLFALGIARGDALVDTAMTAIALAVAAIPEGLPAVVTVTLALGMHRMAKRHAIVKRLAAVETLGCTTVICSDKTGTLTLNQMTARRVLFLGRLFAVSGEGYSGPGEIETEDPGNTQPLPAWAPLAQAAALCADSRIRAGELIGDPTEGALLALAAKAGADVESLAAQYPRIAEIPFDSAYKFMATFHADGDLVRLWVKGAPDVLLARASHQLTDSGDTALDAPARDVITAHNRAFGEAAMRVLAVAGRTIPAADFDPAGDLMQWADALTLIALVGIIDPPRAEAQAAIGVCRQAGVAVKMITGDDRVTAAAIARALGLEGAVREGRDIDGLAGPALAALVEQTAVFARVAPVHKMRIVAALQASGQVVAMTGDGVNDAPALKTADIGVAMGITGTEVTKEAATLVLTDDNFASIVHAIEEGRTIYDNIVKFVRFQTLHQHRRHPDRARRAPVRYAYPVHRHPDPLGQYHHGWPAGHDPGRGAGTPRHHADAAAGRGRPHPDPGPPVAPRPLRSDHGGRDARRLCLGGTPRPHLCGHARLHHLRAVPVFQHLQRPCGVRHCLQPPLPGEWQVVAGARERRGLAGPGRSLGTRAGHLRHRRPDPRRLGARGIACRRRPAA